MQIKYPTSYLAWDLETSGLDPVNDKILEIGMMEIDNGRIVARQSWILKHEGLVISPEITAINGIDQAIVDAEGVDPATAMKEFLNIFECYESHLTHNGIRFDIPFLSQSATKLLGWNIGQFEDFSARAFKTSIDSAVMYKGKYVLNEDRMWNESFCEYAHRVMKVIARGKFNVGYCCDVLGIDRSQIVQHRALGDIELTHHIYQKLITPV